VSLRNIRDCFSGGTPYNGREIWDSCALWYVDMEKKIFDGVAFMRRRREGFPLPVTAYVLSRSKSESGNQ